MSIHRIAISRNAEVLKEALKVTDYKKARATLEDMDKLLNDMEADSQRITYDSLSTTLSNVRDTLQEIRRRPMPISTDQLKLLRGVAKQVEVSADAVLSNIDKQLKVTDDE